MIRGLWQMMFTIKVILEFSTFTSHYGNQSALDSIVARFQMEGLTCWCLKLCQLNLFLLRGSNQAWIWSSVDFRPVSHRCGCAGNALVGAHCADAVAKAFWVLRLVLVFSLVGRGRAQQSSKVSLVFVRLHQKWEVWVGVDGLAAVSMQGGFIGICWCHDRMRGPMDFEAGGECFYRNRIGSWICFSKPWPCARGANVISAVNFSIRSAPSLPFRQTGISSWSVTSCFCSGTGWLHAS